MSNYTRAKNVVESLLDQTFTDEDFVSLIDDITSYRPAQNLTDEEKCGNFLNLWASQLKNVVRAHAKSRALAEAEAAAEAAADAAIANL
jgi:hypothetical protein